MSKSAPPPPPPPTTHTDTPTTPVQKCLLLFFVCFLTEKKKKETEAKMFFKASRPGWWVILWDLADCWGRKKNPAINLVQLLLIPHPLSIFCSAPVYSADVHYNLHEVEHMREKRKKIYYIITISQLTKKTVLLLSFFLSARHIIIMQTIPISRGFVCCLALEKVQHC